jgi:multidrug efflux pump subunit AcrB
VLVALAGQVADIVRKAPGTRDVSDGGATGAPEIVVGIDRQRAVDLGLTPAASLESCAAEWPATSLRRIGPPAPPARTTR